MESQVHLWIQNVLGRARGLCVLKASQVTGSHLLSRLETRLRLWHVSDLDLGQGHSGHLGIILAVLRGVLVFR